MRIALTFDAEHPDRPAAPGGTERVLEVLGRHEVPATFFLQGRWVEAFPRLAGAIADAGHAIGNHSHYHVRMPLLGSTGFDVDVRAAEAAIRGATGIDPRPWFRLPFGSGAGSSRIQARLRRLGYHDTGWDVDVKEWASGRTSRWLVERLAAALRSRAEAASVSGSDGAADAASDPTARASGGPIVVLLHPWATPVADALDVLVPRLAAGGAAFVGLDGASEREVAS